MVCNNLRLAYSLEVGLTQIPAYHETLCMICYVGIFVDFFIHNVLKSECGAVEFYFEDVAQLVGRVPCK